MIKWVEDLGAPALVAAADIATDEMKPTWNRPVGIGLAVAGYLLGGFLGMGGNFTKNIGIAACPWAIESIYQYVKESSGVSRRTAATRTSAASRVSGSRIGRWPAPAYETPFEGVKLE
jgi:hypothetical protein